MMRTIFFGWMVFIFGLATSLVASEIAAEKVGGDFVVKKIEKLRESDFKLTFAAKDSALPVQELELRTDHVHVGVYQGQSLRVSAEVSKIIGKKAIVDQMVVFVQSRSGRSPVWLTTKEARNRGAMPPVKLLEMHDPQTDFGVL